MIGIAEGTGRDSAAATGAAFDGRDWLAVASFGLFAVCAAPQLDHGGPESSAHMLMAPLLLVPALFPLVLRRGSRTGAVWLAAILALFSAAAFVLFCTGEVHATSVLRYDPLVGIVTGGLLLITALKQRRWTAAG